MTTLVDRAADELRRSARAFSRKNLYYAALRLKPARMGFDRFCAGPLAARLARGPIDGLLPTPRPRRAAPRLPEWDAYFPAALLIVDRPELVDLFAASGAIVQARLAVVCVDGTPSSVVRWLAGGFRRGFTAPIGYLHDSRTIFYPFVVEPLKSCVAAGRPIAFRDLGLPPRGLDPRELPFASGVREPIFDVEAAPPAAVIAWATRQLVGMIPRDPWLAPLKKARRAS